MSAQTIQKVDYSKLLMYVVVVVVWIRRQRETVGVILLKT